MRASDDKAAGRRSGRLIPRVRWHRFEGPAVAAACYLLAAGLTRIFWSSAFHRSPLVLFFGAAAAAAWFAGFWMGFAVALASAITVTGLTGDLTPEIFAGSLVMIGVAAMLTYRSERSRETDSELEEANGLLNTVLDQAPIGVALFDRELRYIRVNDALARIDGVTIADHLGKTVSEVLPQLGSELVPALRGVLLTGESVSREITGETPASPGELRHWSLYAYGLSLRGEIIGVGAVCEEVTAKRRAREELQQAMERAEAASEAKDHFLATLSHELRTPLTPVLAIASLLEAEAQLPGYVRKHLAMIRRNVELEARLIDDLLDLTRISRDKIELRPRPTDVRELLRDALHSCCQQDIDSGRVQVSSDFAAASHQVCADAPRLSQVFWNLLNNAVKFTPDGGRVEVRTHDKDGLLTISVADSGAGIEPAELPHIFDAFVSFDHGEPSAAAHAGGLGLGLAISRAILELHGGTIRAESAGRGHGATFTVVLPLMTGVPEPAAPAAGAAGAATGDGALPAATATVSANPAAAVAGSPGAGTPDDDAQAAARGLRILLVEDHPDTAAVMADLLGGFGHQVTVAGGVAAALAAVADLANGDGRPALDLVISDLGLPDGNGQELMRELSRRYGLKGIALSGYGMEEDRSKSLQAGFSRHLTKPIHPSALRDVIREVAGSG
ncbi:MAG TPA: ATP-binding protein [Thermoanaerobaculia bacterium]|nr:ATP-binding protein [Thermoanaerobaculia bacterium]